MPAAVAVPAIAAVGGALISANATSKAASGAQNAARDANALQWDMYQQNRADQAPWMTTGGAALGELGTQMGLSTGDPNSANFGAMSRDFGMADYQADPGYQFRLEQGAKALERAGASRGMTLSGAQMKGLTDYNSGMASQEYGNAYNRFMQNRNTKFGELSNLAGLGQSSVGQTGQLGANTAGQMGSNITGAANMGGAAGLAGANAWTGAINSLGNTWMQYQNQQPGAYSITGVPGASTPNFGNNWGQPVPTVPIR